VFATLIDKRSGATIEPPIAANPSALIDEWRARLAGHTALFIGDAAARDRAIIEQAGAGSWRAEVPTPLAPQIAILAQRGGKAGPPHALTPIYVRRPDAEIERENRRRPKADPERDVGSEGDDR
jgi:tRNA A37 threonylcarbamoyladenosine modification protein TsaB